MPAPNTKMLAVSNVFSKILHFENAGDVEIGHLHNHDHATLISSGTIFYEVLDGLNGATIVSKTVKAPSFIFVSKDKYHRLTALEANTVCACIHALRTVESDLLDPEFLIEPLTCGKGALHTLIKDRTGETFEALVKG